MGISLGGAFSTYATGGLNQAVKALTPTPFGGQLSTQDYLNGPMSPAALKLQGDIPTSEPTPLTAYTAKDYSGSLPEYDQVRQQTSQNLNSSKQANQDALDRRFAANGMQNSGAAVKALQTNDQQADENKATAMNNIGFQEAQTRRQLQQGEENKAFQSGEQTKMFNAQQKTQAAQFNFDANSKIAALDLGYKQAQQQSADEQYNAAMNSYNSKHSGGLLGSGGFLGTGIGA